MTNAHDPISYTPTDGLCYDTAEPKYWDPAALQKEVDRAFDLCTGCRMCFKFCDSFPDLFRLMDEQHGGDVRKLSREQTQGVMDACFQCKLCEVECPYTPGKQHAFALDFPKLVHRWQAQRARREGTGLRDKLLGDPDRAARLARSSLGLANVLNRVRLHRWFQEKLLGIHRDKLLPEFAASTFDRWTQQQGLDRAGPGGELALFATCYVQHNEPEVGRDTVAVLQRNQVDLRCPQGLRCCGMPAWEHGDLDTLRANAHHNLDILLPYVERGAKVAAINPTCSMMMRREYPELLEGPDRERAHKLAAAVCDPSEFLWSIRNEARFDARFASTPNGPVAYHAPCHLRAQAVGFRGRDLLRKIPGVQPVLVSECCGHDGTYAMKVEGFETSQRVGANAFEGMREPQAEVWATDCPLAALQFAQHAGKKPMHPMSILARAYRADGFRTRVADLPAKAEDA